MVRVTYDFNVKTLKFHVLNVLKDLAVVPFLLTRTTYWW